MAEDRSTVAVSRETAVRLKAAADGAGMTEARLLRLGSLRPDSVVRAALEGLPVEISARLAKFDKRPALRSAAPAAAQTAALSTALSALQPASAGGRS